MKTTKFGMGIALSALFLACGSVMAQPKQEPAKQPAKPEVQQPAKADPAKGDGKNAWGMTEDEMKKCMDNAMPGAEHAFLAQFEGTWKTDCTFWSNGVESKSTGTATYTKVLNGLFMHATVTGTMEGMPMPFEGAEMLGYNKQTKKFQSTWTDNMGSGMMVSEGTCDSQGKVFTFSGTYDCPINGHTTMRSTITFNNKDQITAEAFNTIKGKDEMCMKIVYTRIAAAPAKPMPAGATPAHPMTGKN